MSCIGKVKAPNLLWISNQLEELGDLAGSGDVGKICGKLQMIVPEYQSSHVRRDFDTPLPFIGPHDSGVPTMSS